MSCHNIMCTWALCSYIGRGHTRTHTQNADVKPLTFLHCDTRDMSFNRVTSLFANRLAGNEASQVVKACKALGIS